MRFIKTQTIRCSTQSHLIRTHLVEIHNYIIQMNKTKPQVNDINKIKYIHEPIKMVDGKVRIKKYIKIKEVGAGSYSKCFLVKNTDSDSTYVAKVVPKTKLQILNKEKLFYEIKIHKSLSHKNIVHLDHWFEDQHFQYIFLEYCSSGNLQMKIQKVGKMAEKQIKYYVKQIIQALMYLHSQNILHRDLKLCNFYLDEHDTIKLGDFGFACQLANETDKKRQTCGTPNYIAPQAISGFGYSFSSDVWAVGVILFKLKYGFCPFEGKTVKETLENVKCCQYQIPKGVKISLQLKDLIVKIFNINYDDRLTLYEILNHSFFQEQEAVSPKRGFSLTNLFSSKEKPASSRKNVMERQTKKKQEPKRANSCEAFKQIKQIFKTKSKSILTTQTNKTQTNRQMTTENNTTFRDPYSFNKSSYTIIEMSLTETLHDLKKQQNPRKSRINEFVKSKATNFDHHVPKNKKNYNLIISSEAPKTTDGNLLQKYMKKYHLPSKIQQEKDILILHFVASFKQIIYNEGAYFFFKSLDSVFDLKGKKIEVSKLPKLIKYIIEHKLCKEEESLEEELQVKRCLSMVATSWNLTKEGVVLRYGEGFLVSKLYIQEPFYVRDEEQKASMYTPSKTGALKSWEGIVVMRMYSGWLKSIQK